MNIAIIGAGNVGGALASAWASKGHHILIGTRNQEDFKGKSLLGQSNIAATTIQEAVSKSDVVLLSTPAPAAADVARSLGDTTGKVIIDTMNIVMGRGPQGYTNTAQAILDNTATRDVVKCFNTTGFNNMVNPVYGEHRLDMFVAGDSERGRSVAAALSADAGFAHCYAIGGNDKFDMMEEFARFWINLAMFQGMGREIGFKLLTR